MIDSDYRRMLASIFGGLRDPMRSFARRLGARRFTQILVLGACATSTAFATDVFCPTSLGTQVALNSFSPSDNPPNGCFATDMAFTTFSVGDPSSGSFLVTPPSTGDVSIYATGGAGDVTAFFDTPGTPNWSVSTSGAVMNSVLDYTATSTTGFDSLGLPIDSSDYTYSGGSGIFEISLNYCPGQATFSNGCSGEGGIQYQVIGGVVTPGSLSQTFSSTTELGIEETVFIQNGYTLSTLPNEFGDTAPEPSTIALLGFALGGVALIRYRRRRLA